MKIERKVLTQRNKYYYFLILILIVPVLVDLFNGFIQEYLGIGFSVGVLYRTFLLLITFPFLVYIKDDSLKIFLFFIISLWLFLNIFWCGYMGFSFYSLSWEVRQFSRILIPYSLLCFLIFLVERYKISIDTLINYLVIFGFIASSSIIFSFITGMGIHTYGEEKYAGYGVKSFFIAQNDVGLVILLSFTMSLYKFLKKLCWRNFLISIVIMVGLVLLSTRTAILGSFGVFTIFLFSMLFFGKREINIKFKHRFFIFIILSIIFSISAYQVWKIYSKYKFLVGKIYALLEETTRADMVASAEKRFQERGTIKNILGEGDYSFRLFAQYNKYNSFTYKGSSTEKGTTGKLVERDTYDMIGSYGYLLGTMIIAFPFLLLLKMIYLFILRRNLLNFTFLICISIFLGHSFFAGHALNSPTVSTCIVVVYLYILKNRYFQFASI